MGFWDILVGVLFLVISLLLILIVLLQKGKGGGLGAAFGGAGSSAFGTRTGDVFTWITIVLTGLFLLLAVGTNLMLRPAPGLVAKPTFQPPPGPISEKVKVTLACATKGAGIRYTTDGQDPDENSAQYTNQPLTVEPGSVIKVMGVREKWESSPVVVGKYPLADANTPTVPLPGNDMTIPTGPTTKPATPAVPAGPTTSPVPATN